MVTMKQILPNDFIKGFFSGIALVIGIIVLAAVVF